MTHAAVCLLVAAASAAQGAISQSNITPPGGFAQAACHTSNAPSFTSGQDLVAAGSPEDAQENGFAGNSSATASASVTSGSISNSASATMGLGFANLAAHNTGPNSTLFSSGMCNGGWKESFTVTSPSLNGQTGFMVFQIRCRGTIDVTGFAGSAGLFTSGYKDNVELGINAHFNRGSSDAISTDRQRTQWALSSFGSADSRTFDGVVTMAVPVTFGQPFTLGVYASGRAGQRSSSGVGGLSSGTLSNGAVTWNGVASIITSAGAPVADASVLSGSGVNWLLPWTPCGSADFDGDGDVGTDADIEAFFACLAGNCCPTCHPGGADFNGDGDVGTDADIEAYFRVLAGGDC
jgi:hypothetical protein